MEDKAKTSIFLGPVIVIDALSVILAVIGTVLGAINFIHSVTYPVLVLILWLLSCLLIMVIMCAHLGIYMFLVVRKHQNIDLALLGLIAVSLATAIAGGALIGGKHLGVFSGLAFLAIFAMGITDFVLWVKNSK